MGIVGRRPVFTVGRRYPYLPHMEEPPLMTQTDQPIACPKCGRRGLLQELNSLRIIGKKYVANVHHAPTTCLLTRTEFERLKSSRAESEEEENEL